MVHVIEKATIAKSFGSRATFFIFKFILDSKGSVSVTPKIPIRSLKTKCQRLHWFSGFLPATMLSLDLMYDATTQIFLS